MYRVKFVSIFLLSALLLSVAPAALAQGPDDSKQPPMCSDMPDAQIPGKKPGSACRVPVVVIGGGLQPLIILYRSGWTHCFSSESDSDLVEDQIKAQGWLYYKLEDTWYYDDDCEDLRTWSSHAGCRTYGGVWDHFKQDGYHYFHTAGYSDDSFQTRDEWSH